MKITSVDLASDTLKTHITSVSLPTHFQPGDILVLNIQDSGYGKVLGTIKIETADD